MDKRDSPIQPRPELADSPNITVQDEEYESRPLPPMEKRVRHWRHWRMAGLLIACAGFLLLIIGHFTLAGHTMETLRTGGIAFFLILAGAVAFTAGVIGGWITRQRPLD